MEKKKFILPSPLFSAAMATQTYGAVPPANDHYDVNNTRYLDQTPFQWGRFFRAACPILIALLIFGFFGYGMSHGFSHLYGPPKNNDSIQTNKKDSWIPERIGGSSIKGDATKCSKHANCGSLGGYCCPTDEGVMLDCCNR